MSTTEEYFSILGLSTNADYEQIRKAYREKARQYHPDINPSPDAHDQFLKISQAYNYLTELSKRGNFTEVPVERLKKQAQERARAYAKMRYEEFVKQNEAFERTSIHEIYWGKAVTVIITLLALLFVIDTYMPLRYLIEPVLRYEKFCQSWEHCSGKVKTASFTLGTDKTFSYLWQGEELQIFYSGILKEVRYYTFANNSGISFHPPYHTAQYGFLGVIIFICGLVVLFIPLKSFSSRLIIKTIMMFATCIYTLIQVMFHIS
jgi:hypothetical protein